MANQIPVLALLLATLLTVLRIRRMATRRPLVTRADPRPRALVEAVAAAAAVLLGGWGLGTWLPETLTIVRPVFSLLAISIFLSQYAMTMKALRRT